MAVALNNNGNNKDGKMLSRLIDIGIALSGTRELDKLLEMIVSEARGLTGADAGSLFIKRAEGLRFMVSQNETLTSRLGADAMKAKFKPFTIPLSNTSIVGYCCNTGHIVNLDDTYKIPADRPYQFNPDFDKRNEYRTTSMLVVPLKDPDGAIVGALQLINARNDDGTVVPFDKSFESVTSALASQAAVAVRNAELDQRLKDAHLDTIFRLSVAAEYRDQDTANHLRRMSNYSRAICVSMGYNQDYCELMLHASPMHDVGKLGVADAILQKPGRLTDEERAKMQEHTIIGAQILAGSDSEVLRFSEVIAMTHHEKYDGTGYPKKLKGEDIPIAGRIVAVADVFDALCSKRCYKAPLPFDDVLQIMRKDSGTHFDAKIIDAFFAAMDAIRAVYNNPELQD